MFKRKFEDKQQSESWVSAHDDLSGRHDNTKSDLKSTQDDLETAETALSDTQNALTTALADLQDTKGDLSNAQADITELKDEKAAFKANLDVIAFKDMDKADILLLTPEVQREMMIDVLKALVE